MPDCKRLAVMKAVATHLAGTVSVVNGYQHDLAGKVVRGRKFISADEALPMVSILENLNPDRLPTFAGESGGPNRQLKFDFNLLVQGWAKDDKNNPSAPVYNLMADVRKALNEISDHVNKPSSYLLGGLVNDMRMEAGTVRPPEQSTDLAFFWMHVVFSVTEYTADPYRLD